MAIQIKNDAILDTDVNPLIGNLDTRLTVVENEFDNYLPLTGGGLTGPLSVSGANTSVPLILKDGINNYREGLRIMPYNSWSDIVLGGTDLSSDSGISANSWFIGNNDGQFYITKGSSNGGTVGLRNVDNNWSISNGNGAFVSMTPTLTRLTTTSAVRTGTIYMARWGCMVTVMLCAVGFSATGNSQIIATGLPRILTQSYGVWQMHQDNGTGAHIGCLHISGTDLRCHVGNASITGYQTFTYITY